MSVDYPRLMEATWEALYAPAGRHPGILAALPADEADLLGACVRSGGFVRDVCRRRGRIGPDLLDAFPVTFFAFYAAEGTPGMQAFLGSQQWQRRGSLPGSYFPAPELSVLAFAAYLRDTWMCGNREEWVREAFRFELALHRLGTERVGIDRGPGTMRLAAGAWVGECAFDHDNAVDQLRRRCAEVPWNEAVTLLTPHPTQVAAITWYVGDEGRRIYLRGEDVTALRWSWDGAAEVPADADQLRVVINAARAGVLR
ncbi:hypothetical protein [Frankia sp. Cj3]|uniref:hypothetical protein n=1 Tax=Frankia sp. Cj3 TaxID=2880976 RepID=UPI001EF5D2FE|nr:hypothetical protein [Frankia sp. Cj3]